jgi:epoxyqueuosine reductase
MQEFFARQEKFLAGFPEARSVIVLGADYGAAAAQPAAGNPPSGRIARYALSKDYHDLLRARLKTLQAAIQQWNPGKTLRFRATVDTSAVQERAVAEAAGLGFFGKNTCLIRPKGGSFFFLCTLITDLELEIEEPTAKRWDCGACTLCLEACPTGALTEPYRLDASRCISSLTIEHRGPIPVELRSGLGDWVFGCDICQEVCPYNRAKPLVPAEDFPAILPEKIPLSELLSCRSQERFQALFHGTPLTRPGREGLLRNAAIAAGNLRDPALIPDLKSCLEEDPSALVRSHAAWALGQFKEPKALRILERAALSEPDQTVRREILQALS